MKKILISLITITLIVGCAIGGTAAYFTDTEVSTGNTFTTGTIDIAVDGQNPWSRTEPYVLDDMKPGFTDYIDFEITNVGTNPANITKNVNVSSDSAGLASVIDYGMDVEVYDATDNLVWHQKVYDLNTTVANINNTEMMLGMLPVDWTMKVSQAYHMQEQAGNEYQGQTMTFDITLTAEQLRGVVTMYKKSGDPDWLIDFSGPTATLTYGVKDKEFAYTVNASGLADGSYTLISYIAPWSTTNTLALANVTVAGGTGTSTGSIDLNTSLINRKTWLIPGTYTPGQQLPDMSSWYNVNNILFETGLMDYYDADL